MRLLRFDSESVYGYLSLSPSFNPDITFLVGINGSGKTSVIRAISALLTPSFEILAHWDYSRILVEVEHDGVKHQIESSRTSEEFTLSISSVDQALSVPIGPAELLDDRGAESSLAGYYQEQLTKHADHAVLELLNSLPTPMILGIDRRSQEFAVPGSIRRAVFRRRTRTLDMFRGSMATSLREATRLAEDRFREIEITRSRLADKLREKLILSALDYQYSVDLSRIEFPDTIESFDISPERLEGAIQTLTGMGISEHRVREQLTSFFSKLSAVMANRPKEFDFGQEEHRDFLMQWMTNKPQFERIGNILGLVDEHVKQVGALRKPVHNYLQALNAFLNDSGKELLFSSKGELSVRIGGARGQPLSALSSGESQLVVILTHLSFSPAAREANVFIVDEPELSLHVKWQEAFVDAVRTANSKLQIILATHSPSIVLERTDRCVDLSGSSC